MNGILDSWWLMHAVEHIMSSVLVHTLHPAHMQISSTAEPLHLLIVERDDDVRNVLEALFVSQGYTVSCARDPAQALELVPLKVPDVIFSSLVFVNTHGFELCRQLRALPETSDKFIVALTGYSDDNLEKAILDGGFDKYLPKPVSLEVLLSILKPLHDGRFAPQLDL